MATSMYTAERNLGNNRPWYEGPDGICKISEPTLLPMGEDKPPHLIYPTHWTQARGIVLEAKKLARENDALLVLMLYGEAPDIEVQALVLDLADAQVLPLWIGEQNRKKFDRAIAWLSGGIMGKAEPKE